MLCGDAIKPASPVTHLGIEMTRDGRLTEVIVDVDGLVVESRKWGDADKEWRALTFRVQVPADD